MPADPAVVLREVGPRDGLQGEAPLPPPLRLRLIGELVAAGLRQIEVAAFVSERAVPAMAGSAEIVAGLPAGTGSTWWALVPNMVGAERALSAGVDHLTVTVSASEEYSRRNVSMSVAESAEQATAIAAAAPHTDVVISCAFGSPYEGEIAVDAVASLAGRFSAGGATVTLADTTGMASPRRIADVLSVTGTGVGLHLHDTRGTALVNAYAALELGVVRFDSSVGGLGGSPFATDAGGNLATEDLVYLLDELGRPTGVDLGRLIDVDVTLRQVIGRPLPSRVAETELRHRATTPLP
jgi:hydroxymethylglutaryl-CoA lyase